MAIKEIDEQGRIVIPKSWRKNRLKGKKIVMRIKDDDSIEITPYDSLDLTKYFDVAEVDVKGSLADWHSIRKELRNKRVTRE